MTSIVSLIVAIVMAVWVYQVVKRHGGKLPWLWAIGTFVFWPLAATIAGFKYNKTAMMVAGIIGLGLIVLGIVMAVGMVAMM